MIATPEILMHELAQLDCGPPRSRDDFDSLMGAYDSFLSLWRGTKYRDSQRYPHIGVDCRNFVFAAADFLHGRDWRTTAVPPATIAQPVDVENLGSGDSHPDDVFRILCDAFPSRDLPLDGYTWFPGDIVLLVGRSRNGHMLIAGPRENTYWQSARRWGVDNTGLGQVLPHIAMARRLAVLEEAYVA